MEQGREKLLKLDGGGAVASTDKPEPFASDPHLEGLNQMRGDPHLEGLSHMGDGGDGRNRSLYLALCRRNLSDCQTSSPLYKLDVDLHDSDSGGGDDENSLSGPIRVHRRCDLDTDMVGMTFVSLQSGWIFGIGGSTGSTIIFDTKSEKVIRGPELVSRKWKPIVAVVGDRIYALTGTPEYVQEPNFSPWFEVLDISNPVLTETAEGVLHLDSCSWKALPHPVFFPYLLTPRGFRNPSFITVRSSVVVGPYILVSLNQPSNCTFAFDTNSGEWHKIVGKYLPFVGAATPHGIGSDIFLAFCQVNGPIKAYRIQVSTTTRPSDQDYGINLSITEMIVRNKDHFEVGVGGECYISLDREHFSVLFWHVGSGRYLVYDQKTQESYQRKLYLKLVTYRTERPVLQGKTPEIVISSQREQAFKICSCLGFSSAPIAFALSPSTL